MPGRRSCTTSAVAKTPPQMGRYTFEEKMEYWAFAWGAIIMGATGFMMWNPISTVKFLPGEVIPAAKAAHGGEALLAVLAIIIWHMYGVHIKRFNKSMWTGKMSEKRCCMSIHLNWRISKPALQTARWIPIHCANGREFIFRCGGIGALYARWRIWFCQCGKYCSYDD